MPKESPEVAAVKYLIKVLYARQAVEDAKHSAIDSLQRAIDYAKEKEIIDITLVNRATRSANSIPELQNFANSTVDLRAELIFVLKGAVEEKSN